MEPPSSSLRVGAWLAVLSAVSFGVTAPLVKRAGEGAGPFATAALLYLGAALVSLSGLGSSDGKEAPLRARDAPRLVLVAVLGAVLAPTLLAWGLQRTSAGVASLLLNLEAVFTVLLGFAFYGEAIGPRVGAAVALLLAASSLLVAGGARGAGASGALGAAAVAGAALGWALDNAATRPLSDLDPARVVLAKSALGAALSLLASLLLREPRPVASRALALLACGGVGYGLSLRLYLLAQRRLGAGRTGSLFALGPFVGVLVAWALGDRALGAPGWLAAALFALGVYLHVTESHGHAHRHARMEHEHAHRHDDGHHDHPHEGPAPREHSHPHRHDARAHAHPHGPDAHHQHAHSEAVGEGTPGHSSERPRGA